MYIGFVTAESVIAERVASRKRAEQAANSRLYRERHPNRHRASVRKYRYGISEEQVNALLRKQKRACAICRTLFAKVKGRTIHVDHCHRTKKVRGLLCHNCNILLGSAKDDTQVLHTAIRYLNKENDR